MAQRKQVPLRLDPAVHDALAKWAADELRSVNSHIEILLRAALKQARRLPSDAKPIRPRGRPPLGAERGDPAGSSGPEHEGAPESDGPEPEALEPTEAEAPPEPEPPEQTPDA